jgi:hypothetical protein
MPVTHCPTLRNPFSVRLLFALLFLITSTCTGSSLLAQGGAPAAYDFYVHGPYRRSVPRPSAALGFEIGQTHSTFRDQERAVMAIAAAASDRVKVVEYGKSVEG